MGVVLELLEININAGEMQLPHSAEVEQFAVIKGQKHVRSRP